MPVSQIRLADPAGNQIAIHKEFSADKDAPTLLALHGFTGSGRDFDPVLDAVGRNRVHSLCMDFSGHGDSDSSEDPAAYGLISTIELIERVRQIAPDPDNVYLLAYSMGGRIGLHYLERFKTKGALLIGSSPGLKSERERSDRVQADLAWIKRLSRASSMEDFCTEWEAQPVIFPQTQLPEPVASDLACRRRKNDPVGLKNALMAWGNGILPSLWHKLPNLPGYDLIVGENDSKFLKTAESMRSCNSSMRIHTIPSSAHSPHLENPKETASVIRNVLKI